MRRHLAPFAALLLLVGGNALGDRRNAARADDATPTGDLKTLQGTWTAKVGPQKQIPITMTVTGARVKVELSLMGEQVAINGELKLDEKGSPRQVDWVKFTNPQGEPAEDNKGIYKFSEDGKTWTVCNGGPGNARPTEFKAGEEGGPNLIEFTRANDAPKPRADDAPKGDLARFQGNWKSSINNGEIQIRLTVKGDAISAKWTRDGNEVELKGKFQLNESTTPKTIDFVEFKRPDGEALPDNPGIYVFDGEAITICAGGGGNARPTEFKAGEGGQPTLFTLEKVKD